MITVTFKDMEKSDLARNISVDRVLDAISSFPEINLKNIAVTLSMENSPQQPGPDQFTAKFRLMDPKHGPLVVEKSAENLYIAIAEVCDALPELINRRTEKARTIKRSRAREAKMTA